MSTRRPLGAVDVNRQRQQQQDSNAIHRKRKQAHAKDDEPLNKKPTIKSSFMQPTSASQKKLDSASTIKSSKENVSASSSRSTKHQTLSRSSKTEQTDTSKLTFHEQKQLCERLTEEFRGLKEDNDVHMEEVRTLRQTQKELINTTQDLSAKIQEEQSLKAGIEDRRQGHIEGIAQAQAEQELCKQTIAELDSSRSMFEGQRSELAGQLQGVDIQLKTKVKEHEELKVKIENLKRQIIESKAGIQACHDKAQITDLKRRKFHNEIQELRGNIRVFCRVRPSKNEDDCVIQVEEDGEKRSLQIIGSERSSVSGSKHARQAHEYSFDRVFGSNSSQGELFAEVEQVVQSALDGYKVCIFAYGQTGSGKTFTMEGPEDLSFDGYFSGCSDEKRGMIPRAVEQIFASVDSLAEKGWTYRLEASFLEIYCESIRDLLGKAKKGTEYNIKHSENDTTVTNLSVFEVNKADDIYPLLAKAAQARSVGKTSMNSRSSRSHSIFQLKIMGHHEGLGKSSEGMLNLIDLAGSERLKSSKSDQNPERLKETQFINKSLSCIGDIIKALGDGSGFIPYRNSKLTYLLKNCFGGHCKTMMLVNIAPEESHTSETISSLRFASKVNSTHIGTARKNTCG